MAHPVLHDGLNCTYTVLDVRVIHVSTPQGELPDKEVMSVSLLASSSADYTWQQPVCLCWLSYFLC